MSSEDRTPSRGRRPSLPVGRPALALGLLAAGAAAGFLFGRARAAGVPTIGSLTYSGVLTAPDGTALTGPRNIQLQIWTAATGGDAVCSVGPTSTPLVAGAFQLPLPVECVAAVHGTPDLWLEPYVDGGSMGRVRIGAVPYALEADTAARALSAGGTLAQALSALEAATSCPGGWFRAGNLCVENMLRPAATMLVANGECGGQGGHVCTHTELQQVCGSRGRTGPTDNVPATFNPFGDVQPGWYGDHAASLTPVNPLAPSDDLYLTWNLATCNVNNDGNTGAGLVLTLPYRCCR